MSDWTRLWKQLLFTTPRYIHIRLSCKFSSIWQIVEDKRISHPWKELIECNAKTGRDDEAFRLLSLYSRRTYRITVTDEVTTRSSTVLPRCRHVNLMMARHKVWRLLEKILFPEKWCTQRWVCIFSTTATRSISVWRVFNRSFSLHFTIH